MSVSIESHKIVYFFISTVYCLHDFTYALLHANRQLSIMCFVFCYILIFYLLLSLFNFWR